jgi:hypothetical protein
MGKPQSGLRKIYPRAAISTSSYRTCHGRQIGLNGKKPGTSSLECARSVLTAVDAENLGLQCAVCCRCMFSGMDGAHVTELDYASYLLSPLLFCSPFLGAT